MLSFIKIKLVCLIYSMGFRGGATSQRGAAEGIRNFYTTIPLPVRRWSMFDTGYDIKGVV